MDYKHIINLQLFAEGEKTEKPTPKKRKDAREKGEVLHSKEINSALILMATFLGLKTFGGYMYENLYNYTTLLFTDYPRYDDLFTLDGIEIFALKTIVLTAEIVGPIVAIAFIAGLVVNYMQVGFLFTTKTLAIKLDRINPIEGFKRIISKRALVELFKSIIKIIVVVYIVYIYFVKEIPHIFGLINLNISSIVKYISTSAYQIGLRAGGALIIIAILDYGYQWWEHESKLKMTKQEVKEEYKQTEGDPKIKAKIKEKQRKIAMQRMMQDIPRADVIITNPTHYAIALIYDNNLYNAPYVLAKGVDTIAQNIKKVGNQHEIPIVENKPLAQAIYKSVDIGELIPEELFQAVAEILAYVYSLKE